MLADVNGRYPNATERHAGELAGFGSRPSNRPRMRLVAFKPMLKGSLRGFADVEMPDGLRIRECPVHLSHDRRWAALPAKPQIDRDGQVRRDERGKALYVAILEWSTPRLREAFSDRVVELVDAEHPEAFGSAS